MSKLNIILLSTATILGVGMISYGLKTHSSETPIHMNQESTSALPVVPTAGHAKFYETVSLAPLTICEAIHKATQAIEGKYDALTPINDAQKKFIAKQYMPYMQHNLFDKFSGDELKSYASRDYQYLNDILKKNGFSIQLKPFPSDDMGIVAIQDILVKWPEIGEKVNIESDGQTYEGVFLKKHINFFTKPDDDSTVIVELLTQADDKLYFVTKRDGQLFEQTLDEATVIATLLEYQGALRDGIYQANDHYSGVKFPMIMYNKQPDISWILKLELQGAHDTFKISQALQEVIFKMNEKGAQAKAATAIVLELTSSMYEVHKEILTIDKPFLIWIERPGVPLSLFADYMTKEYWQNPGELPE